MATLLNLKGEIVEQYRYTAFGEREVLSSTGQRLHHSAVGNPWQYAGKRFDEESGLIAFGLRYYDPVLGRWITPDPAGFADGPNLYAYVHNTPLLAQDPFGLFTEFAFGALGIYQSLQSDYRNLCTPMNCGPLSDPMLFPSIQHINIENNLENRHWFRKQENDNPFYRTQKYCINDFVNLETGQNYAFPDMPPNKEILFINGIDNTIYDFQTSLLHIANMSGYNVKGIFCPTFGKLGCESLSSFPSQFCRLRRFKRDAKKR